MVLMVIFVNKGQVGIVDGWICTGAAPGGGNSSLFTCLLTNTTAAAPINRIHSGRSSAICPCHGSIKEMSGRELIRLLLLGEGTSQMHIARRETE